MGWIKPMFLPSPQATFQQFYEYLTGTANDKPLWQHFAASMFRVFAAFFLACIFAFRLALPWACHASGKVFLTRPSSCTAPCRRWLICR
jgi:ABC-type nitrate/sulfonate/bicarbonate transport system permease component